MAVFYTFCLLGTTLTCKFVENQNNHLSMIGKIFSTSDSSSDVLMPSKVRNSVK